MVTASSRTSPLLLLLAVQAVTYSNPVVQAQQPVYVYYSDYPSMTPSDVPSDAPSDVPSSLNSAMDEFSDFTEAEPMVDEETDPLDGTISTESDGGAPSIEWTTEEINVDPLEEEPTETGEDETEIINVDPMEEVEPTETGDKTENETDIINVDPVDDFEEETAGDTEWSEAVSIGSGVAPIRTERANPIDIAGGTRRNRQLRG